MVYLNCSLGRVVGLGGLGESLCLYKYALGFHSVTEISLLVCACHMCVHIYVTPLQPNELEAITGRQGCYGD